MFFFPILDRVFYQFYSSNLALYVYKFGSPVCSIDQHVAIMPSMCRVAFSILIRFQAVVFLIFGLLRLIWVSLFVFTVAIAVLTFWMAFWRLSTEQFVTSGVWTAWQWFSNDSIGQYKIYLVLRREKGTVFYLYPWIDGEAKNRGKFIIYDFCKHNWPTMMFLWRSNWRGICHF